MDRPKPGTLPASISDERESCFGQSILMQIVIKVPCKGLCRIGVMKNENSTSVPEISSISAVGRESEPETVDVEPGKNLRTHLLDQVGV